LNVDLFRLRSLLAAAIDTAPDPAPESADAEPAQLPTGGEPMPLAPLTLAVLSAAQRLAGEGAAGTGQLLEALLITPCMAGGILNKLGVTPEKLRPELAKAAAQPGAAEPTETGVTDLVALAKAGKLPPPVPRPRYTDAAARALLQEYGRGVLLAGETGSGRWSIVLALAVALAQPGAPPVG